MIKLSVSVMAHPRRARFIPELVERLGIDKDQVAWDQKDDRWDTGRRAWEMHDPQATHHLVLQDDSIVCRDLIQGLTKALEHVPKKALVSPFMGTRRPAVQKVERLVRFAEQIKASWIVIGPLNWGISILTPTDYIDEMLDWGGKQRYPNYDKRIGQFYRRVKTWPTWYAWPNLVEHRDTPSLVGHGPGRVAHRFVGEDASALDWDPTGQIVDYGRASTMGSIRVNEIRQQRKQRIKKNTLSRQEERRELHHKELKVQYTKRVLRRERLRKQRKAAQEAQAQAPVQPTETELTETELTVHGSS